MRGLTAAAAIAAALAATGTAAGEEGRGGPRAHEHGRSTLEVAVEGGRVAVALAAPGADLVGFEHAAATDAQRAAVERARAALAEPLALLAFPPRAGCRLTSAEVTLDVEDGEEGGHAEFRAGYELDCAEPAALAAGRLDLGPFFGRFPGTELVEVRIVSGRGQASREATRGSPTLSLDPAS
jgi:Protein of unknown function (DUF2796)